MIHCIKAGIPWQGLKHDLSKYSPTEFIPGARYYLGTRSPNEEERRQIGYSKAWIHHKGRNRHHFEYWVDYNMKERRQMPVKMPLNYVIEMFCDRVAASKIYNGKDYTDAKPLEYFGGGHAKSSMHPETAAFIEKLLTMLAEQGEKVTFRYIRGYRKRHKDY